MWGNGSAPAISRSRARTCIEAVARECQAVRQSVGIFDASTLGKIEVVGPDAAEFMNRIYVNAWTKLEPGRCRYGVMLREDGSILDDGVVGRLAADRFHVTTTTGGAAQVLNHMEDYLQTEWSDLDCWLTSTTEQWAVIAVQGPDSRNILERLVDDIDISTAAMPHMSVREGHICGVPDAPVPRQLHRRARLRDQCSGRLRPRRLGGGVRRRLLARHHALRHRSDACAARREGLHHRRPGHRRHGDARRRRPRLGDRQGEEGFRRQALARAPRDGRSRPQATGRPSPREPRARARGGSADRRRPAGLPTSSAGNDRPRCSAM